jgi:hypothetical protein
VLEKTIANQKPWSREKIAEQLAQYEQGQQHTPSQRQLAEELQIPRCTLQHWLKRRAALEADPDFIAFFESPVGVAFLHRLGVGAHFVITLLGSGGIRLVGQFLELTGLAPFVASSYGAQHPVAVNVEKAVVAFGQAETRRLAVDMPHKQITVCEDETFHPAPCLVAIEPVSNYIVVEQYADNRQASTWTQTLTDATQGLPVEIIQATSDEGRSICHHVEEDLGGHHSPDLFHVQQELVRGCSVALASRQRHAAQALAAAVEAQPAADEKPALNLEANGVVRGAPVPPSPQEQAARQALQTVTEQQARVKRAVEGISVVYHPYALQTGQAQSTVQMSEALAQHFVDIESVATETQLPERCVKKIRKAKRVVVKMLATTTFFWMTVRAKVTALALSPEVEQAVHTHLIPGIYLDLVSAKVSEPQERATLQQQAQALLTPLRQAAGPLAGLVPAARRNLETVALECAQVFQRSSSCVEGRNGQLALQHHSLHRLSQRKLAALTTVHNYFIQRQDGTTAAERFFGAKPKELFEWILERVALPGWSAPKRAQPPRREYLAPALA